LASISYYSLQTARKLAGRKTYSKFKLKRITVNAPVYSAVNRCIRQWPEPS